jgi:hypothetical protein
MMGPRSTAMREMYQAGVGERTRPGERGSGTLLLLFVPATLNCIGHQNFPSRWLEM